MNSAHRSLAVAIRLIPGLPLLSSVLLTAAAAAEPGDAELAPVIISATALTEAPESVVASYSVLDGKALFERAQATLGDTLSSIPGVRADSFGGGASRPVIRGQSAPRVQVLSDSSSLLDASSLSPDHAVTSEPLLAQRIEVLRGPATLLYGSGAIGGVVNVLDRKIPTARPKKGLEGSAGLRGGTAANEKAGAAEITGALSGNLLFHVEGAYRDAQDYRVPDFASRRVQGTAAESRNGSAGLSWVADRGYLGLAWSYRNDDYGLPGHSHEFEDCHPHGATLHCGAHEGGEEDDHAHEHGAGGAVPQIDLLSRRLDLRGELDEPLPGFERLRLRASHTGYRHDELEEGQVSTTFLNDGAEARVELQHVPLGRWRGVAGLQYSNVKFSALGEEAFMPVTRSESLGLFAVEHFELDDRWHFEFGARQEWQSHRPIDDARGRPRISGTGTSLSAATIWELTPGYFLTLSGARSERLPQAQELYARGIHLASNTYECGMVPHPLTCGGLENNAALGSETSNNVELRLRKALGSLTFTVSGYVNEVSDYIYARTLDRIENFRLIKYTQGDASFRGMEAEAIYAFTGGFSATAFGDFVRAKLDDGGNLPRIPAGRYGVRLNATSGPMGAEAEYTRVRTQGQTADYETMTPGYDLLNLTLTYSPTDRPGTSLYLRASNLLDSLAFNHASYLANVVPLPGRALNAGVRVAF